MAEEALTETPDEKAFFESGGQVAPKIDPASEPAPTEPADAKEQKQEEQPKYVPLSALHEERQRRKELQEQIRQSDERRAKMEARFEDVLRRVAAPPVEQKADWDTQPIDAGKQTAKRVETVEEKLARLEQKEQVDNALIAFNTRASASAQEFTRKQLDFPQAYQYWAAHVAQELHDAGWTDPAAVSQQVMNFERALIAKAFQDGVNPAERLYNVAKRRGYSSKAPEKAGTVEEKIDTLEKGQKAAKSLSSAQGAAEAPLTLESLADMDDEDFDKNWDKVMKAANRRR